MDSDKLKKDERFVQLLHTPWKRETTTLNGKQTKEEIGGGVSALTNLGRIFHRDAESCTWELIKTPEYEVEATAKERRLTEKSKKARN